MARGWTPLDNQGVRKDGERTTSASQVRAGSGYLTIRAVRSGKLEDKHRTEFRYGSFSRTVQLPPDADTDDVTTGYSHGILTVKLGLKGQRQGAMRRVQVAGSST